MRLPDFFYGTPEADSLFPSPAWKVIARAGDDFVVVDQGSTPSVDNTVILYGKAGDDFLRVQDLPVIPGEFLYGGNGNDGISFSQGLGSGQAGDDSIGFGRRSDVDAAGVLRGGDGDDSLSITTTAGTGSVIARGGNGDDAFFFEAVPGIGRSRLVGGDGADNFGNGFSRGRATIVDFDFAAGDRLDIPNAANIDPNGVVQEIGGTTDAPFLLVSFTWRFQAQDLFTSYKLLGLDAPLSDAAFI